MNTIISCFERKVLSLQSRSSLSCSSSPSITPPKYFDVFLSFRGTDTRKNFISLLHKELLAEGIRTFKDENDLQRGCPIHQELREAIEGSRIAVVVVSANYPASAWCLKELVKILDREQKGLLTVVPIFYGVEPSDVRRKIGEVAKQFKKHERRQSRERVESWRHALSRLASLCGECSKNWEDDLKLVDGIIRIIWDKLSPATPSNGNYCFLENVTRDSLHRRHYHLQEELLSKMQGQGLYTESSPRCLQMVKARLRNKKVLLVANEKDNIHHLEALDEEFNWFGPGSRIIITTPDRQLPISWGVRSVYEVEILRCYQVRQLFRSLAFKLDDPVGSQGSTNPAVNLSSNDLVV